jgi:asparagine synthase (glutamine-hydrolysing)
MCGIAGFWQYSGTADKYVAAKMLQTLHHRGPDDFGIWLDGQSALALAHRRLSILDLSNAGHQPMISPCRRYVLIYNGEIYNQAELRKELDEQGGGFYWQGHSDTEILLAGLRHWGVKNCIQRINGMFAFAFWDCEKRQLILARDRMGEKPVYYGLIGDTFLFGSELKALVAHPSWRGEISRESLALFLQHGHVPTPNSIYQGILKLPAAHYIVIGDEGRSISAPVCYWDLAQIAERGALRHTVNPDELIDSFESLLRDSVSRRMTADVPLGAFLSGGIDSSLIVALMQAQSSRAIKTFSIGFSEPSFNEGVFAKAVASHLCTDHTELEVTDKEALTVIPMLPLIYDEPFADSSQISTFLVSQLARQNVTVVLSGDGGDELYCGYNRYLSGYNIWNTIRFLPPVTRCGVAWALRALPAQLLDSLQRQLPKRMQVSSLPDRLPKFADSVSSPDEACFYASLTSSDKPLKENWLRETPLLQDNVWSTETPDLPSLRERMMYWDQKTYLSDDILTKVDRASMAVGLEVRVPFLDHRIVEFAWNTPTDFKYKNGQGKWLLRQVLYRYIPRKLIERPKMGFGVPIEHWLRGPLRDWASQLLDENGLEEDGLLNAAPIQKMWKEHLSGKRRWHFQLWNVLMFQAWNRLRKT